MSFAKWRPFSLVLNLFLVFSVHPQSTAAARPPVAAVFDDDGGGEVIGSTSTDVPSSLPLEGDHHRDTTPSSADLAASASTVFTATTAINLVRNLTNGAGVTQSPPAEESGVTNSPTSDIHSDRYTATDSTHTAGQPDATSVPLTISHSSIDSVDSSHSNQNLNNSRTAPTGIIQNNITSITPPFSESDSITTAPVLNGDAGFTKGNDLSDAYGTSKIIDTDTSTSQFDRSMMPTVAPSQAVLDVTLRGEGVSRARDSVSEVIETTANVHIEHSDTTLGVVTDGNLEQGHGDDAGDEHLTSRWPDSAPSTTEKGGATYEDEDVEDGRSGSSTQSQFHTAVTSHGQEDGDDNEMQENGTMTTPQNGISGTDTNLGTETADENRANTGPVAATTTANELEFDSETNDVDYQIGPTTQTIINASLHPNNQVGHGAYGDSTTRGISLSTDSSDTTPSAHIDNGLIGNEITTHLTISSTKPTISSDSSYSDQPGDVIKEVDDAEMMTTTSSEADPSASTSDLRTEAAGRISTMDETIAPTLETNTTNIVPGTTTPGIGQHSSTPTDGTASTVDSSNVVATTSILPEATSSHDIRVTPLDSTVESVSEYATLSAEQPSSSIEHWSSTAAPAPTVASSESTISLKTEVTESRGHDVTDTGEYVSFLTSTESASQRTIKHELEDSAAPLTTQNLKSITIDSGESGGLDVEVKNTTEIIKTTTSESHQSVSTPDLRTEASERISTVTSDSVELVNASSEVDTEWMTTITPQADRSGFTRDLSTESIGQSSTSSETINPPPETNTTERELTDHTASSVDSNKAEATATILPEATSSGKITITPLHSTFESVSEYTTLSDEQPSSSIKDQNPTATPAPAMAPSESTTYSETEMTRSPGHDVTDTAPSTTQNLKFSTTDSDESGDVPHEIEGTTEVVKTSTSEAAQSVFTSDHRTEAAGQLSTMGETIAPALENVTMDKVPVRTTTGAGQNMDSTMFKTTDSTASTVDPSNAEATAAMLREETGSIEIRITPLHSMPESVSEYATLSDEQPSSSTEHWSQTTTPFATVAQSQSSTSSKIEVIGTSGQDVTDSDEPVSFLPSTASVNKLTTKYEPNDTETAAPLTTKKLESITIDFDEPGDVPMEVEDTTWVTRTTTSEADQSMSTPDLRTETAGQFSTVSETIAPTPETDTTDRVLVETNLGSGQNLSTTIFTTPDSTASTVESSNAGATAAILREETNSSEVRVTTLHSTVEPESEYTTVSDKQPSSSLEDWSQPTTHTPRVAPSQLSTSSKTEVSGSPGHDITGSDEYISSLASTVSVSKLTTKYVAEDTGSAAPLTTQRLELNATDSNQPSKIPTEADGITEVITTSSSVDQSVFTSDLRTEATGGFSSTGDYITQSVQTDTGDTVFAATTSGTSPYLSTKTFTEIESKVSTDDITTSGAIAASLLDTATSVEESRVTSMTITTESTESASPITTQNLELGTGHSVQPGEMLTEEDATTNVMITNTSKTDQSVSSSDLRTKATGGLPTTGGTITPSAQANASSDRAHVATTPGTDQWLSTTNVTKTDSSISTVDINNDGTTAAFLQETTSSDEVRVTSLNSTINPVSEYASHSTEQPSSGIGDWSSTTTPPPAVASSESTTSSKTVMMQSYGYDVTGSDDNVSSLASMASVSKLTTEYAPEDIETAEIMTTTASEAYRSVPTPDPETESNGRFSTMGESIAPSLETITLEKVPVRTTPDVGSNVRTTTFTMTDGTASSDDSSNPGTTAASLFEGTSSGEIRVSPLHPTVQSETEYGTSSNQQPSSSTEDWSLTALPSSTVASSELSTFSNTEMTGLPGHDVTYSEKFVSSLASTVSVSKLSTQSAETPVPSTSQELITRDFDGPGDVPSEVDGTTKMITTTSATNPAVFTSVLKTGTVAPISTEGETSAPFPETDTTNKVPSAAMLGTDQHLSMTTFRATDNTASTVDSSNAEATTAILSDSTSNDEIRVTPLHSTADSTSEIVTLSDEQSTSSIKDWSSTAAPSTTAAWSESATSSKTQMTGSPLHDITHIVEYTFSLSSTGPVTKLTTKYDPEDTESTAKLTTQNLEFSTRETVERFSSQSPHADTTVEETHLSSEASVRNISFDPMATAGVTRTTENKITSADVLPVNNLTSQGPTSPTAIDTTMKMSPEIVTHSTTETRTTDTETFGNQSYTSTRTSYMSDTTENMTAVSDEPDVISTTHPSQASDGIYSQDLLTTSPTESSLKNYSSTTIEFSSIDNTQKTTEAHLLNATRGTLNGTGMVTSMNQYSTGQTHGMEETYTTEMPMLNDTDLPMMNMTNNLSTSPATEIPMIDDTALPIAPSISPITAHLINNTQGNTQEPDLITTMETVNRTGSVTSVNPYSNEPTDRTDETSSVVEHFTPTHIVEHDETVTGTIRYDIFTDSTTQHNVSVDSAATTATSTSSPQVTHETENQSLPLTQGVVINVTDVLTSAASLENTTIEGTTPTIIHINTVTYSDVTSSVQDGTSDTQPSSDHAAINATTKPLAVHTSQKFSDEQTTIMNVTDMPISHPDITRSSTTEASAKTDEVVSTVNSVLTSGSNQMSSSAAISITNETMVTESVTPAMRTENRNTSWASTLMTTLLLLSSSVMGDQTTTAPAPAPITGNMSTTTEIPVQNTTLVPMMNTTGNISMHFTTEMPMVNHTYMPTMNMTVLSTSTPHVSVSGDMTSGMTTIPSHTSAANTPDTSTPSVATSVKTTVGETSGTATMPSPTTVANIPEASTSAATMSMVTTSGDMASETTTMPSPTTAANIPETSTSAAATSVVTTSAAITSTGATPVATTAADMTSGTTAMPSPSTTANMPETSTSPVATSVVTTSGDMTSGTTTVPSPSTTANMPETSTSPVATSVVTTSGDMTSEMTTMPSPSSTANVPETSTSPVATSVVTTSGDMTSGTTTMPSPSTTANMPETSTSPMATSVVTTSGDMTSGTTTMPSPSSTANLPETSTSPAATSVVTTSGDMTSEMTTMPSPSTTANMPETSTSPVATSVVTTSGDMTSDITTMPSPSTTANMPETSTSPAATSVMTTSGDMTSGTTTMPSPSTTANIPETSTSPVATSEVTTSGDMTSGTTTMPSPSTTANMPETSTSPAATSVVTTSGDMTSEMTTMPSPSSTANMPETSTSPVATSVVTTSGDMTLETTTVPSPTTAANIAETSTLASATSVVTTSGGMTSETTTTPSPTTTANIPVTSTSVVATSVVTTTVNTPESSTTTGSTMTSAPMTTEHITTVVPDRTTTSAPPMTSSSSKPSTAPAQTSSSPQTTTTVSPPTPAIRLQAEVRFTNLDWTSALASSSSVEYKELEGVLVKVVSTFSIFPLFQQNL